MAEVTEQRGLVGEAEVFWQEAPGLPVLYLHGVPTDGDDWLSFLEQTGGFAPDLPGFGRSSKRGDLDFSMDGPVTICSAIEGGKRRFSSVQNRSSGQSSTVSVASHCT